MKVHRGDIVYLKRTTLPIGNIQGYIRPHIVVSNDIGNKLSGMCLLVPLTTKHRKLTMPTHAVIAYHESMAICEQIFTANQYDVKEIVGTLSEYDMKKIDLCLRASLGV